MKPNKKTSPKQEQGIDAQIISLDKIQTSKLNPRRFFDENSIAELAESIKKVGVIQPITVRQGKKGMYEIICGERRYRASVAAEKTDIPVYIKNCNDDEFLEIAFIENIQREDVSEIETAEAIKSFIDSRKEDFNTMAVRLGKSVKYIRDRYQLNNLIDEIKALVQDSSLTVAKAILLSAYDLELQKKIVDNNLKNQYNSWLDLSYTKFANALNSQFNTNLHTAKFDTSECEKCPFNSAVNSLFVEKDDKKCLKKACFMEKHQNFAIQKAIAQIEENPTVLIMHSHSDAWFLNALKEQGVEIATCVYDSYPTEPDKPEAPKKEDSIDPETKEFDAEDWQTAQDDYKEEIEEYNAELIEYEKEVAEIETKIAEGKIEKCFVIRGNTLDIQIRSLSEEETQSEDISSQEKSQLEKLNKQDERNSEIKIENSVKDIKDLLFPNDGHFTEVEGTKIEQDIFFFYVFSELSHSTQETFFEGKPTKEKDMFDFISKMTPEQRMSIIRSFIVSKLRSYAFGKGSVSTQLLLEFAKLHKEKETLDILAKYQAIYDKRKGSIEAKKGDILAVKETIEENIEEAE